MTYHLSTNTILTTLHAMAALQSLSSAEDERAILAPILCRERTNLLTVIITNAFTETVLKLTPFVSDYGIDDEDDNPAGHMWLELNTPAAFTTSRHSIVRRAIEQTIALTALRLWCTASTTASNETAEKLIISFDTVAEEWLTTAREAIMPPLRPTIRSANYL